MKDTGYIAGGCLIIGIIIGVFVGIFFSNLNKFQPSCNCVCPIQPTICGDDKKPYVTFSYGDDIILFNDHYDLTKKEFIDVYEYVYFDIRINNNATSENKTLCMEYKYFDEIRIDEIYKAPAPDNLTIRKDYRVDCWQLPEMQKYERLRYKMEIRSGNKIGEQEVRIWTQAR